MTSSSTYLDVLVTIYIGTATNIIQGFKSLGDRVMYVFLPPKRMPSPANPAVNFCVKLLPSLPPLGLI